MTNCSHKHGLMLTCRLVHVSPLCFILTEVCSCRLELADFAGKISKNRLVCKNAAALAYYGSCRLLVMGSCCILFPYRVTKGKTPGLLVAVPYQKSYSKALGKDGILNCHEQSVMHKYASHQADLFKQTFENPDRYRVDSQLATSVANQVIENKEYLRQIVLAVEFLTKQGLDFRGHRDDRVDFLVMKLTEETSWPCYNYWRKKTTILFRSTSCHQADKQDILAKLSRMMSFTCMRQKLRKG